MCPDQAPDPKDDFSKQRLEQLLACLNADTSLIGYMIINQSGGVLLADLPSDLDAELISFRFLAIVKNCNLTLEDLNYSNFECISFQTDQIVITAFELSQTWLLMLGPIKSRHNQFKLFEKANDPPPLATGKFLLTKRDLDQLKNLVVTNSELELRKQTLEASEDLQTLLLEIGQVPSVIGCVVVGHDGLLIANTMPTEVDAESIGVWSLGVYMNTEHVMRKFGHERVHQIVNKTPRGHTIIADFGGGLLVALTLDSDAEKLVPLMRKITDLVS